MTASDMAHEVALSRVSQHLRQTMSLNFISGGNPRSLVPSGLERSHIQGLSTLL